MDTWQRNLRMMHQVSEFLDLDSTRPSPNAATDLIALIDAVREGLQQVDEEFKMPDSQINSLFLSKLKSRPEWSSWASSMMRDTRIHALEPSERMSFRELAELAVLQEKSMQRGQRDGKGEDDTDRDGIATSIGELVPPRQLTQDEINAFVMRQMDQDGKYARLPRGHVKRPSQEEINEFVVRQMRREQEQKRRNRSQSHPDPGSLPVFDGRGHVRARCDFCGDSGHAVDNCWRKWRVAAELPQGNYTPKRVEFKTKKPGLPTMYRTGFTLY